MRFIKAKHFISLIIIWRGHATLLDITPDKCEAVMQQPAVMFLPRKVQVLPRVGAVVVELEADDLLEVVPRDGGEVPAEPGRAPPASLPPGLSPADAVPHVPESAAQSG